MDAAGTLNPSLGAESPHTQRDWIDQTSTSLGAPDLETLLRQRLWLTNADRPTLEWGALPPCESWG